MQTTVQIICTWNLLLLSDLSTLLMQGNPTLFTEKKHQNKEGKTWRKVPKAITSTSTQSLPANGPKQHMLGDLNWMIIWIQDAYIDQIEQEDESDQNFQLF